MIYRVLLFVLLVSATGLCGGELKLNSIEIRRDYLRFEDILPTEMRGTLTVVNETGQNLQDVKTVVHIADEKGQPLLEIEAEDVKSIKPGQAQVIHFYRHFSGTVNEYIVSADVTWRGGKTSYKPQKVKAGPARL